MILFGFHAAHDQTSSVGASLHFCLALLRGVAFAFVLSLVVTVYHDFNLVFVEAS